MKSKIFTLAAVLLMMLSFGAYAQNKATVKEVSFTTDIDCANCKKKCDAILAFIKGVKDYAADIDSHIIYFKYDSGKVTASDLRAEIEKLGYKAEETETVVNPKKTKNSK
ncbi:MAG: heavy-metal-associated domain-containing protein [Bacteroidales bacterium]|nr:heavy-metal-associated domain-containing protein [Bacteroidales bacterium]